MLNAPPRPIGEVSSPAWQHWGTFKRRSLVGGCLHEDDIRTAALEWLFFTLYPQMRLSALTVLFHHQSCLATKATEPPYAPPQLGADADASPRELITLEALLEVTMLNPDAYMAPWVHYYHLTTLTGTGCHFTRSGARQQFHQHPKGVCLEEYVPREMSSTLLLVCTTHGDGAESRRFVTWYWGCLRFSL